MLATYEFAILALKGRSCTIRFGVLHNSVKLEVPLSTNFYFQVLIDCFDWCLNGFFDPNEYERHPHEPDCYKKKYKKLAENSPNYEHFMTWVDYFYDDYKKDILAGLADIFIHKIVVLSQSTQLAKQYPYWEAEVQFEVSTPELLAHLKIGMRWLSTNIRYC